jgi:hypothetical protein
MKWHWIASFLMVLVFFLQGCISQITPVSKGAPTWIGSPIKDIQNRMARLGSYATSIGWKEKVYKLDSGNWVFVEPADPRCFIHWEVNSEGIIVGYKTEGRGCD